METHKVLIGSVTVGNAGLTQDTTREVEFVGELLSEVHQAGEHKGNITDTRGTNERLFRTEGGKLVVHIRDWSNWQGEATDYSLREITEDDLTGNGWYWRLGQAAGLGKPLTLGEALSPEPLVEPPSWAPA